MTFKTPMLQSDLCDYSGPYIVVERIITVSGANNDKKIAFKQCTIYFQQKLIIHSLTMQKT